MVTSKKAKYEPFGDELCVEVAYLQAAALLDCAAEEAIYSKDTERMQYLAFGWMELGKLLMGGPGPNDEDDDEDEDKGEEPIVLGFNNSYGKADFSEQVGRPEADTSGDSSPRVHPKHGEL